jgi:hypothetical protein
MGDEMQKEDMVLFASPPPPRKGDGEGYLTACLPGFVIQAENTSGRIIYVNIIVPAYVEKGQCLPKILQSYLHILIVTISQFDSDNYCLNHV